MPYNVNRNILKWYWFGFSTSFCNQKLHILRSYFYMLYKLLPWVSKWSWTPPCQTRRGSSEFSRWMHPRLAGGASLLLLLTPGKQSFGSWGKDLNCFCEIKFTPFNLHFFSEKNYSIFSVLRIDWLLVKFIGTYILWWRIKSSLPVLLYKKRSQRYQNWK